jgi:hypothetical protein
MEEKANRVPGLGFEHIGSPSGAVKIYCHLAFNCVSTNWVRMGELKAANHGRPTHSMGGA